MSDESNINFSVAEKYSYVYADEKFSKLAVTATGDAKLVDPLAWSYAETHSYVKVDPSSVGVSVPSGVDALYAKVIYIPGGSGGGSSGSGVPEHHTHSINDITNLSISLNALSSAILTHTHPLSSINGLSDKINELKSKDSALSTAIENIQNQTYSVNDISGLTEYVSGTTLSIVADSISGFATEEFVSNSIPKNYSDLTDDIGYATTGYVLNNIPSAVSQFVNDAEYVTSSYVDDVVNSIEVPTKTSELENDSEFITSSYVDDAVNSIEVPTKTSDLENDSEYATSGYVNEVLETIEIPTKTSDLENDSNFTSINDVNSLIFDLENSLEQAVKSYVEDSVPTNVSELANDANYVPLSAVQEMMNNMTALFNQKMILMELRLNNSATIDMGEHGDDPTNNITGGDREDESLIFDFGERNPNGQSNVPQDYSFEDMQQQAATGSVVLMNSRLDKNGSYVANDRLATDTNNETINFNYR